MKVMQKDNMTVRSWRRLHRRRVLLAAAALCAICAMGLAAWYWLSPRIYEAKLVFRFNSGHKIWRKFRLLRRSV